MLPPSAVQPAPEAGRWVARPAMSERFGALRLQVPPKQFLRELFREINEDDIFNGAAALGFFLTLAIFPAMVFLMAVIPYLPIQRVDVAIMDLLRQALPPSASEMFAGVVAEVTKEQRGGLLSLGFLGTLWATSSGMYAVMQQLNVSYDVREARGFFRARLTAIALSILFSMLVLGAFSLIVLGGQIQDWVNARYAIGTPLLVFFATLRWLIIVGGLLLGYALIYFLAPDVKQRFVYITPGSVVGVTMLVAASLGFAWYTQNLGNYAATYGSVGAMIVLMLWLYIAGLSILLGSEINALVEHHAQGGKVKGEHRPGEKAQDPAIAAHARQVDAELKRAQPGPVPPAAPPPARDAAGNTAIRPAGMPPAG
jgi:membrane protein